MKFQRIHERSDPTEAAKGPTHVLNRIKEIVQEMMLFEGINQTSIKCMGMGIPGLLNPDEGLSIFSPNFPGWENIHVVNQMKSNFDFPVLSTMMCG